MSVLERIPHHLSAQLASGVDLDWFEEDPARVAQCVHTEHDVGYMLALLSASQGAPKDARDVSARMAVVSQLLAHAPSLSEEVRAFLEGELVI
jgi:hypothetical protein